jgi:hypothetical protein
MYMLFNNIVSDTIHSVVVCVDFLGTHIASLVFFGKLGVTCFAYSLNLRIDLLPHLYYSGLVLVLSFSSPLFFYCYPDFFPALI